MGLKNIDEAIDGVTALDSLRSKKYDLIISDWNIEPMTGLELLKTVRGDTTMSVISRGESFLECTR